MKIIFCRLVCFLILLVCDYGYSNNISSIAIGCCKQKVTICRYWEVVDGTLKERILIFNGDSSSVNISVSVVKLLDRGPLVLLEDVPSFGTIGGPWDIPPYESMVVDSLNFNVPDSSRFYFKITGIKKDSTINLGYISPYNYKPLASENKPVLYYTSTTGRGQSRNYWWELESPFIKSGSSSVIKLHIVKNTDEDLIYGSPFEGIMLKQMDDSLLNPGVYGYLMPDKIEAPGFYEHYTYAKDSLEIWGKGIKYIINYTLLQQERSADNKGKVFTITYHITAPPVDKPAVEYLKVFIKRGKIKGYSLPINMQPIELPIIIKPIEH